MEKYFSGNGTAASKFPARIRHVIDYLIKHPRANASAVHNNLSDKKIRSRKTSIPAEELEEFTRDFLGIRLDIIPARYTSGSGTCFVYAKLAAKNEDTYTKFETTDIMKVEGVIEWDRISGRNKDYLIRVVGGVGHDIALRVCEAIQKLPCVEEAYMAADITIWKSGVVNNITADHFFEFEDEVSSD